MSSGRPVAAAALPLERLNQLLNDLVRQGLTQQEISRRTSVPAQYISDLKRGRRPLGELLARRLGEEFGVDYLWLLGETEAPRPLPASSPRSATSDKSAVVPLLRAPVAGDPRACAEWDGAELELSGVAAARAKQAGGAYVLRFDREDPQGLLRAGDLLLISQDSQVAAEISVVRYRRRLFLARRNEAGEWSRVAGGLPLAGAEAVGHALGIIWRGLAGESA